MIRVINSKSCGETMWLFGSSLVWEAEKRRCGDHPFGGVVLLEDGTEGFRLGETFGLGKFYLVLLFALVLLWLWLLCSGNVCRSQHDLHRAHRGHRGSP